MRHLTLLTLAALAASFLAGCIGTPDAAPHDTYIRNTTTLGEYSTTTEVSIPQNIRAGLFYVEGPTLADALETLAESGEIVSVLSNTELERYRSLQASQTPDEAQSWLIELFAKKGYLVHSPVLNKSHRSFRLLMIQGELENDPQVIAAVAELSKAISENNTEAIKHSLTVLKDLGVELGPQIIEQLITPGL